MNAAHHNTVSFVREDSQRDCTRSENKVGCKRRTSVWRVHGSFSNAIQHARRQYKDFADCSPLHKACICQPILSGLIPLVFILVSYAIAVTSSKLYEKDVPFSIIPYISDIGNLKPQSSVFTLGLALGSFCSLVTVILRYYQGKAMFRKQSRWLNRIAYLAGWSQAIGKLLVCTFQLSSISAMHYIGAFFYVVASSIYCGLQAILSRNNPEMHTTLLIYIRVFCASSMVVGATIFIVFLIPSLHRFNRGGLNVAQGAEWFFASVEILFMITFFKDFMMLRPSFRLCDPQDQENGACARKKHGSGIMLTSFKDAICL